MLWRWTRHFICHTLWLTAASHSALASREDFHEDLVLRLLPDGRVSSKFTFTTLLRDATPRNPESLTLEDDSQHYTLFPLALGQVLREYAITEMHLNLNAGKWNYDRWGYPDEPGVGTGAELWAWMGDGGPATFVAPNIVVSTQGPLNFRVDHRWQGLRNALAGLFCASLGSLDDLRTTSPTVAFEPEGILPNWPQPHQLRHASLPSEHVCTENLTPFLKLLPCKSLSGVASLLNPHRLFDADWHGMGVHVSFDELDGVRVRLTFQTVFDPVRGSSQNRRDWSFASLFDRKVEQACPVASTSVVRIALPEDQTYLLTPGYVFEDGYALFDMSNSSQAFHVAMEWPNEPKFSYPPNYNNVSPVPLSVQRTLRGPSQARGELSVVVTNHESVEIQTVYLETMPWLLQFYLHTLRVTHNGEPRNDLISNISYSPPLPHARPTTLQCIITVPPRSTIYLTIDVSKSFLRYTEHPPDAQRGWDLPPAVFVPVKPEQDNEHASLGASRYQRIYTPTLLADLATPDFSMPYNVIILSCTLITLIFGTIFNVLTRKFVVVHLDQPREAAKTQ
ncbi:hypothetical protein HWV62_29965 [Athelia sp. TMB]|nr:hypothetical protein HWV62_29965 [Athelia sp. TMB]